MFRLNSFGLIKHLKSRLFAVFYLKALLELHLTDVCVLQINDTFSLCFKQIDSKLFKTFHRFN